MLRPIMRHAILWIGLSGFALVGCREQPRPPAAEPAPAAKSTRDAGTAAPASPATSAPPKVDCEGLVGQADASRIVGSPLVPVDPSKVGPRRCRYGVSADATTGAQVDVIYMCGPAALPMYRSIDKELKEGGEAVSVGKKSVMLRKDERGIVQFLDEDSPCAAEVVAVPADKAVEAARLVAGKLKGPVL
jgi:hypothetical protein